MEHVYSLVVSIFGLILPLAGLIYGHVLYLLGKHKQRQARSSAMRERQSVGYTGVESAHKLLELIVREFLQNESRYGAWCSAARLEPPP